MSGAPVKPPGSSPEMISGSSTCIRARYRASSSAGSGRPSLSESVASRSSSVRAPTSSLRPAISRSPNPGPRSLTIRATSLRSFVARSAIFASWNCLCESFRRSSLQRMPEGVGRSDAGGGDLLFQGARLRVEGGQVLAGPAHAGVLRADEAGVRGYRLAHPLDGAVQLGVELPPHHLAEALAQGVRLLAEL